uniref:CCT domain-containing protein n=1 Tax=Leersia perrieri TaxID=77586 RepID=A0A0D9VPC8_9ORYZ
MFEADMTIREMMMFEADTTSGPMLANELCIEGLSSLIAAQILDFCDDGLGDDLFAAVATTSEPFAASSEDGSSSSATTPPLCSNRDDITAVADTGFSPLISFDSTLSAFLEQEQNPDQDTKILPSIDETFTASAYYPAATDTNIEKFNQIMVPEYTDEPMPPMQISRTATAQMPLASGFDDECFTAALAGGYMGLDGTLYHQTGGIIQNYNVEAPQVGFFNHNSTSNNAMLLMDMTNFSEYQRMMEGDGLTRTYSDTDSMQGAFNNPAEMQMGENSQHMITGCNESAPTLPSTEGSSLEDAPYKGVRLTAEQRKEKIDRYIKKRNERNFSKKIKYACRKTLADSRPRVRGRFAKNDDLCEAARSSSQNSEEYEHIVSMKGEDLFDSSDILAHLSGVISYGYKYNCAVESWI